MTIPSRGFCLASSSALCLSWSQEWTFSGRQEEDGGVQRKTVKSGSPSSAQQVRDILHSRPCCAFCPITPVCLHPREWEISGLRTSSCNQRWRYKIMDPWCCLMSSKPGRGGNCSPQVRFLQVIFSHTWRFSLVTHGFHSYTKVPIAMLCSHHLFVQNAVHSSISVSIL